MVEGTTLEGAFDKTERLVAGVRREQWGQPTSCSDYGVAALIDHLVGTVRTFAAGVAGQPDSGGSGTYATQGEPAREFREAADRALEGWREGAADRLVQVGSDEAPGSVVFNLMLVECVAHGWDLATATGQPAPYSDAEAEAALAFVTEMLQPEHRGPDQNFGPAVPVPADAPPLDHLMGFLGRHPAG